ncbi:clostripain-related cysteine peptidase [Microbacterium sp. R86528]|uniref:clostripain-related cysteine peptidase n=1 Tax=Microbacterium sp. R86528 TaxID=3093864 RepID=UPI0037C9B15E
MGNTRLRWWTLGAIFAVVLVGLAVLIAVTSSGPDGDEATSDSEVREAGSWTLMVYMIADTDLEPFALDDLAEMASVGSTDDVNIVALVDRSPDYSDDPAVDLADWEDTVAFRVEEDHLQIVDEPGELNMGDPETLADFVADTAMQFPADHYGLVLWDHGAGWPGMGPDETNDFDVLTLPEMNEGLSDGLERAGIEALDFVGFDACLMATYEVASIMSLHAEFMLASQELEPGHGWNYQELAVLTDGPQTTTATDLGTALIDGYALQADEWGTGSDITLALLDLSEVTELQAAVAQLAGAYEADPDGLGPTMARAQSGILEFGRNPDPELATDQIDLGSYVENLAESGGAQVADAADAVTASLEAIVVAETTGPATDSASGLSIYFPEVEQYFLSDYLTLEDVPAWPGVLSAFFESGRELAVEMRASFEDDETATDVSFSDAGVSFTASIPAAAAAAVISSTVSVGYRDGDDIVYVAEMAVPLSVGVDRASMSVDYDLTYMTLSDGESEIDVYQDVTTDPETGYRTIDVPLEYVSPDDDVIQDALLSIIVDDDDTILEEDFYLLDDSGTYGALVPDSDGWIYPVALVLVDDEQWEYERTDDDGISADLPAIEYALNYLEPGTTLVLDADVQDYGQQADTVSVEVDIP